MANLMELLQGQMTPQMIAQLASQIGGADQKHEKGKGVWFARLDLPEKRPDSKFKV